MKSEEQAYVLQEQRRLADEVERAGSRSTFLNRVTWSAVAVIVVVLTYMWFF